MRLSVLRHCAGNRPPAALQIDVGPFHRPNLTRPLRGQQLNLKRLGGRRRDVRFLLSIVLGVFIVIGRLDFVSQRFEAHPQLAQLVVAEHAIARALLTRLWNTRCGAGFDPFAVEREIEHPRQHAKSRRAARFRLVASGGLRPARSP